MRAPPVLFWQVHGLEGVKVVSVACGWRHSIAADDVGSVYTFGWCKYGQLGHGDTRCAGPHRRRASRVHRLRASP